jgi:hypothetical protein
VVIIGRGCVSNRSVLARRGDSLEEESAGLASRPSNCGWDRTAMRYLLMEGRSVGYTHDQ